MVGRRTNDWLLVLLRMCMGTGIIDARGIGVVHDGGQTTFEVFLYCFVAYLDFRD